MTIDFARLLGVSDLLEATPPLDYPTGFDNHDLIVKKGGQWALFGKMRSITIHQDTSDFRTIGGGYHEFVAGPQEIDVAMVPADIRWMQHVFYRRDNFEIAFVLQSRIFKSAAMLRSIGDIPIGPDGIGPVDIELVLTRKISVSDEEIKSLEQRALDFATVAHSGQLRKYDGRPYVYHPIAVAEIVRGFPHTEEMIAGALLHDVVEMTSVTIEEIRAEFGDKVAELVDWLTDVSRPEDGSRAERKALDRRHIAKAPAEAQTIKLADIIDNAASVMRHDPDFWKVYGPEKRAVLEVLKKGNPMLLKIAEEKINQAI